MSGLIGHSGRTGNLGQIGSGEILIQDQVVTSAAGIINVAPVFTSEFRNYKTIVTDLVVNTGSTVVLYFRFLKLDGNTVTSATYRTVTAGCEAHAGGGNNDQFQKDWNNTQAVIDCAGGSMNNDAGSGGWNAEMHFPNPYSASRYSRCLIHSGMLRYGGDVVHSSNTFIMDVSGTSTQMQGFQLFLNGSANFVSGKFTTYGYRINKDYNI